MGQKKDKKVGDSKNLIIFAIECSGRNAMN